MDSKPASLATIKAPEEVGGTHYQQGISTSPWDLQQTMRTSCVPFVDARRADVIKYVWRKKGDQRKMIEDMLKARHCLDAAINILQREIDSQT